MEITRSQRRLAIALLTAAIVGAASSPAHAYQTPAAQAQSRTTVVTLLNALPVAAETDAGYDRDLFNLWITVEGCDTRERVLARQNLQPANSGDCGADYGSWFSAYDGDTTTDPGTFDIDHVVPLAEAWDSGAIGWSSDRREAYANDATYRPALIAVSASSNRSKGEKDPAEWMPERQSYWCTYLRSWVGVKYRWKLAVDTTEKSFISSHLAGCKQSIVTPPIATVGSTSAATPAPTSTNRPSPAPSTSGSLIRYVNCTAVRAAGITPIVQSRLPELYALNSFMDRDHDGIACE